MAKALDIQLHLLRSGHTAWDEEGRVQGRTDLPLTNAGLEAIEVEIREILAEHPGSFGTIYCGPEEACQQTAAKFAAATSSKVRTEDELATMNLGLWEGLLETEIEARYPTACRQWQEAPSCISPPQGEPFEEFEHRVRLAVCRLLEKANGKPVAFVLRPLPYATVACWLLGKPIREIWSILDDGPASQRHTITRARLKSEFETLKAQA